MEAQPEVNPMRLWRDALGLTQREVARLIGCSEPLIAAWESAICGPTDAYEPRVAEVHQKSPEEIAAARDWIWTERTRRKAAREEKGGPIRRGRKRGFPIG